MTERTRERIAFDVETERILQILSAEIYDSPKAFLRENVQNAYDAILMRCTAQGLPIRRRRIQIAVGDGRLSIHDDGIGMTEDVLRRNFWKAGSSGKKGTSINTTPATFGKTEARVGDEVTRGREGAIL